MNSVLMQSLVSFVLFVQIPMQQEQCYQLVLVAISITHKKQQQQQK